jgi:Uma2 family endonuclease
MIVRYKLRPRKTLEDFMRLPEGTLAELIDGELLMSPTPKPMHQQIVGNLFFLLKSHIDSASLGRVFVAPLDVHLPSGDIVEPDIIFIEKMNLGIIQDWIRGAPDLLVEVLSPTGVERDRFVKHKLYGENGVREYWIVDPGAKAVEIFSLAGNQYEPNGYVESDEMIESPLLPQFRVQVADLFIW